MTIPPKSAGTVAFALAVLLFLFGSATMTVAMLDGGIAWNSVLGGFTWMWMPPIMMLALFVLLVWVIFELKE